MTPREVSPHDSTSAAARRAVLRGAALGGVSAIAGANGAAAAGDDPGPAAAVVRGDLVVDVNDFGARGTGTADDTAAIQAAIDATPDGGTTLIPAGRYRISASLVPPATARIAIRGSGAAIVMTGTGQGYAAFSPRGTSTGLVLDGLNLVGSGSSADGHQGFGNASGVVISDLRIMDCSISQMTVGISLNADTSGLIDGALVTGCTVSRSVGTASGQGYGIHHACGADRPTGVRIIGNTVTDCDRHAIYQAKGRGVVIAGNTIRNHRSTAVRTRGEGSILPAINVGRSEGVVVTGNCVLDSAGGALYVGGTAGSAVSRDYTISGNVFQGSTDAVQLVTIGQQDPAAEGSPDGVRFTGNVLDIDGGPATTLFYMCSGLRVRLSDNLFRAVSHGAAMTCVRIAGVGDSAGTARCTDQIVVDANDFVISGQARVAPVRLSGAETSAITMTFRDNTLDTSGSAGTDMFAVTVPVSDPHLTVSRQSSAGLSLAQGTRLRPESWGHTAVGMFGANGATPVGRAPDPGTATGEDAEVINALVVALRRAGLVT